MLVVFIFAIFEPFLFPDNIFVEDQFNPATLYQEQIGIVLGAETKFGLSDLRTYEIYSQIKYYGIGAKSFGNELYKENVFDFGFGFPLFGACAAGVNLALLNYWIKDNYSRFGYALRMGSIFQAGQFALGGWLNNLNQPQFSDIDYVPLSYSLRCQYLATENLAFNFAVRGLETDAPFFNFGLFFMPYKTFTLGASINSEPILLEYGLRLKLGEFVLYYTGSNHRQLGFSHQFRLGFGL